MGRKAPVLARAMFWTAAMISLALVLAACGGNGTPKSSADATGVAPPATDIRTGSSGQTDPCSVPLPTDGFALATAADLPTVNADGSTATLGSGGAAAILDQLVVPERSMCALEVSPPIQSAIDAVRTASTRGDRSEVRRLLEQLVRVDLQAAAPRIKNFRGSDTAQDVQKARDSTAVGAEAYAQGEDDLGDEAMEQARAQFTEYAEKAIAETDDVKDLLAIAADAQRLGLEDLALDALEKAKGILEKELEAVSGRFDPCTANAQETRDLVHATARVQLIGGDSSDGDALITASLGIFIRRANGEPIPECDPGQTWSLAMSLDVEGVSFLWDGVFSVTDGGIEGDGIGTLLGSGDCVENGSTVEVYEATGTFTFEVAGSQASRNGTEWLTLRVSATEADVELSSEDAKCAGLAEIAQTFLSLVPTFPGQYYAQGFDIQMTDGTGFASLAMEPYSLEVTVTQLDG